MHLRHERAKGDTLSKFAVQLAREGVPVNLTGFTVKFMMVAADGTIKIPETAAEISNPTLGFVEYDFQATDVNTAGLFKGFFIVYGGAEPDTYPAEDEGIEIEIFDRQAPTISVGPGLPSTDLMRLLLAPKRTRTIEGTVEERSITELIEADRYLRNQEISDIPWGIRIARTKPPGTCS